METTVLSSPASLPIFSPMTRRKTPTRISLLVVSVLTRPTTTNNNEYGGKLMVDIVRNRRVGTTTSKTVYNDNWFDRIAITYLSRAVTDTVGMRNEESSYEGLVAAAAAVFRMFKPAEQRQLVVKALEKAIPGPIQFLIKTLAPPSKFTREYFAAFTTVFFSWLIGPCEVRESEFEGRKERNVVHVKKCRFLEETNCVGMCTNLCKMPSQEFIKNSFGIPVNMVPNFDDMSCEMIFGQDPPAQEDDPAFKQPCYKLCNAKQKHSTSCIS